MKLPRGKVGKNFLNELCRLITLFTEKTIWEPLAFSLVHIFVPLMLQKPSARSKPKENCKYIQSRLEKWEQGNLDDILSECKEIQLRIKKLNKTSESNKRKLFCRLMLERKIGQASKLIDNANRTGLLPVNEDTIRQLQAKHPPAMKRFKPEVKPSRVEPVIFEATNSKTVQSMAKKTFGSGGPTLIDADCWKHMLCSRSYGSCSDSLAQDDIKLAFRTLQTCSGMKSGIEAAVHPMADKFAEDKTEGLLLVDATNAFNSINREMALHSVAERCPVFHQYLKNTYQAPTKLYISGSKTGEFIWGEEGNTQGGVAAMPFYGLATMPIIDDLQTNCDTAQAWYADDSSAADTFTSLLDWWIRLNDIGPKYGYFPNANKTILIVKHPNGLEKAKTIFGSLGIKVTSEGQRHLGAVIGSTAFKKSYVESKV
eukprot:gene21052-23107_t